MAQCMGYLLVACRGPAVKSRGQGRVSCTDTSPQLDLSIWVPNSFVIDCVCWVVWACLNVLCWHGPLLERSLSCACMGDILLARGVIRTLLATGTILESTAGMFLRIRSDIYPDIYITIHQTKENTKLLKPKKKIWKCKPKTSGLVLLKNTN